VRKIEGVCRVGCLCLSMARTSAVGGVCASRGVVSHTGLVRSDPGRTGHWGRGKDPLRFHVPTGEKPEESPVWGGTKRVCRRGTMHRTVRPPPPVGAIHRGEGGTPRSRMEATQPPPGEAVPVGQDVHKWTWEGSGDIDDRKALPHSRIWKRT